MLWYEIPMIFYNIWYLNVMLCYGICCKRYAWNDYIPCRVSLLYGYITLPKVFKKGIILLCSLILQISEMLILQGICFLIIFVFKIPAFLQNITNKKLFSQKKYLLTVTFTAIKLDTLTTGLWRYKQLNKTFKSPDCAVES